MVEIEHVKTVHPQLLALGSISPTATWDDLRNPEKAEVRKSLNDEQNGLCAYCERQLPHDHGRIDHIVCQKVAEEKRFEYRNLCHSCSGRYIEKERETPALTCDQYKDDKTLGPIEPRPGVNKLIELNISTGSLHAATSLPLATKDNVETALLHLGLNNSAKLIDDRKASWEELIKIIEIGGNPLGLLAVADEYYWTMREYFSPKI